MFLNISTFVFRGFRANRGYMIKKLQFSGINQSIAVTDIQLLSPPSSIFVKTNFDSQTRKTLQLDPNEQPNEKLQTLKTIELDTQ